LLFDDTNKVQYIVSRGSSNLTNWIKDAEYRKTLDSKTGIYIHRGFADSAREIYDNILSKLNTDYTTYLTGHSLGGAITVILHLYLMKAGFSVKQSFRTSTSSTLSEGVDGGLSPACGLSVHSMSKI